MNFISICSGIEAASVAFLPLGWKAIAFSEIEPFPCAVLAHHYPEVPNFGDMSKFREWPEEIFVDADAIVGGPPCQAFSVAGLRNGLNDDRGNLTLTYAELIDHADAIRLRAGKPPVIVLYENVPGLLSDKTGAFGCFLGALAGEDGTLVPPGGKWTDAGCVFGPQRAMAWRLLDAQYFAVAQRRRRVFVVASAREGFDPAAVLFEFDGVRRDTAPSREAGEGTAGSTARSVALRGRDGGATAELGDDVQNCLRASSGGGDKPHVITMAHGQGGAEICFDRGPTLTCNHEAPIAAYALDVKRDLAPNGSVQERQIASPLTATDYKDPQAVCVTGQITNTLKAEGFDASEDVTGRGTPLVPVGVTIHGTDPTVQKVASYDDIAQCLRARTPGNIDNSSTTVVQQPIVVHGTQDPCHDEHVAFALGRNSGQENAIAFSCKDHGGDAGPISPTLRSMGHDGSHANAGGQVAVAFAQNSRDEVRLMGGDGQIVGALAAEPGMKQTCYVAQAAVAVQASQSGVRFNDTVGTLDANYGSRRHNGVMTSMKVRRLTPRECERLQGFPEIVKTCTITVFQHSNSNVCLSDQQGTNVLAALQSHKSPNNASPAEENVFPSNANAAEQNLNVGQASSSAPVLVNAQIDLERQHLQLHSQGKLLLSVSIADASEWCRLPIQAADFVQLSAALLTWLERKAPHGRAESRLNTSGSFPLLIGNLFASLSGQEIEELASDAGKFTSAVKDCMKSITSEAGRNSKSCDSILQTLLCCVLTAISSFIPEETRAASSYALSVEVSHGYTLIPWRKKPASECPDGPRYKALGNSWAVPNVRWIGRRIDAQLRACAGSISKPLVTEEV